MKRLLSMTLALLLLLVTAALADERILSFHSEIVVLQDGSQQVTETIRVRAEGQQIRQGIYRDFPTDYKDRIGNRYRVGFEVLGANRDGHPENYFTQPQGNGVRIYLGRKGVFLSPGNYAYELTYRTDRQLGFFADHDELYWNVTGNGWDFPIDRVSARVLLPEGIPSDELQADGYTGPIGSKSQDYQASIDYTGEVTFTGTRPLGPREGLTIVVTWPKGYIQEPTQSEQVVAVLHDNRVWLVALAGLLVALGYYLLAWVKVGRDPEAGVVIPLYQPPKGFSPASSRFIRQMGYDHKAFSAALVNLAVKGLMKIREDDDEFTLERTGQPAEELAAGEKALLKGLFPYHMAGQGEQKKSGPVAFVKLEQKNHAKLQKALKAHKASLQRDYEKRFFLTNRGWLIPGLVLSLLAYGLALFSLSGGERLEIGAFMSVWLSGWTAGVVMLLRKVWAAWKGVRGGLAVFGALFVSAFSIPFVAGEVIGLWVLATQASPALPVLLLVALGLNYLFYQLLKAPTRAGRFLLDKLEGFRLYLEVAEKDELNLHNPPEKTPELFEAFLPFALALNVEQRWTERFAGLFANLSQGEREYHPGWYHGQHWQHGNLGGFTSSLGSSLSSAVSSSSTAPGSSSGSGGGGSSGGGGGGGGGGGW